MCSSKWVVIRQPKPTAKLKLICFPYAGGDASVFSSWADKVHPAVEVLAIQAPGRSNRLSEPALRSIDQITESLCSELLPFLDRSYAVLGHSLGARIAYEFVHKTRLKGLRQPVYYIGSGSKAPHVPSREGIRYDLPDNEFIEAIKDLGGTPKAVIENKELMDLVLPTLKADFFLVDTYRAIQRLPLDIPASIFNGLKDYDLDEDFNAQWQTHFSEVLEFKTFDSGHFFINDMREEYLLALNNCLTNVVENKL